MSPFHKPLRPAKRFLNHVKNISHFVYLHEYTLFSILEILKSQHVKYICCTFVEYFFFQKVECWKTVMTPYYILYIIRQFLISQAAAHIKLM